MQNVHMIDTSLRTPVPTKSIQTADFWKQLSSSDMVYSWQIQSIFVSPAPPNKDSVSRMPTVFSSVSPSKSLKWHPFLSVAKIPSLFFFQVPASIHVRSWRKLPILQNMLQPLALELHRIVSFWLNRENISKQFFNFFFPILPIVLHYWYSL